VTNSTRRQADLSRRAFERILLIKPSSLGDVVHALPVLHGLRRRYPNARIDWLISTSLAPLIEGHPDLSELVPFDRRRYGRMAYRPTAAADFVRFIER
jgi:ADP-heptose:LPS heptosyltransferase